jgi:hypothetical protein
MKGIYKGNIFVEADVCNRIVFRLSLLHSRVALGPNVLVRDDRRIVEVSNSHHVQVCVVCPNSEGASHFGISVHEHSVCLFSVASRLCNQGILPVLTPVVEIVLLLTKLIEYLLRHLETLRLAQALHGVP